VFTPIIPRKSLPPCFSNFNLRYACSPHTLSTPETACPGQSRPTRSESGGGMIGGTATSIKSRARARGGTEMTGIGGTETGREETGTGMIVIATATGSGGAIGTGGEMMTRIENAPNGGETAAGVAIGMGTGSGRGVRNETGNARSELDGSSSST